MKIKIMIFDLDSISSSSKIIIKGYIEKDTTTDEISIFNVIDFILPVVEMDYFYAIRLTNFIIPTFSSSRIIDIILESYN